MGRAPVRGPMHPPAARLATVAAAALLAAAVPLAPGGASASPSSTPVIAEVFADPEAGSREFVELWNRGNGSVEMAGWKLRDASGNTFTFPPWTLGPQGRVVVWGGGSATAEGPAWSMATAWNNAGDTVLLLRPDGSEADRFQYGTADHPAAPKGQAWVLRDTWAKGSPTPGRHPDAVGGSLGLSVENVAPTVAFTTMPTAARPLSTLALELALDDPNGAADIASWSLKDQAGALLAQGSGGGLRPVSVTTPAAVGPWTLRLEARDQQGLSAMAEATLVVQEGSLAILLPAGGAVPFPPLKPGGRAMAGAAVTIENVGLSPVVPLLDVSDFRGPGTFPAAHHLVVHLAGAVDASLAYTRPLQALPELPPGAKATITFEVVDVPMPLPAGAYGTSFSLVTA